MAKRKPHICVACVFDLRERGHSWREIAKLIGRPHQTIRDKVAPYGDVPPVHDCPDRGRTRRTTAADSAAVQEAARIVADAERSDGKLPSAPEPRTTAEWDAELVSPQQRATAKALALEAALDALGARRGEGEPMPPIDIRLRGAAVVKSLLGGIGDVPADDADELDAELGIGMDLLGERIDELQDAGREPD